VLFTDDIHAEFDTLIANKDGWPRDELTNFVLALSAERAVQHVLGIATTRLIHFDTAELGPDVRMLSKRIMTVHRQLER
jgi:hypothetical protein